MTQQQPTPTRPIILRPWEVKAVLAGTLTQIWRAMKRQPDGPGVLMNTPAGDLWYVWPHEQEPGVWVDHFCTFPWGKVGSRIWGRESWADVHPLQAEGRYSQEGQAGIPGPPGVTYRTIYRADGEYPPIWHATGYPYRALRPGDDLALKHWPKGVEYGWESSTSMPLWASRITLEIEAVSALPVQGVTGADAKAAGADGLLLRQRPDLHFEHVPLTFQHLWDQSNPRHPYATNPMAWRLVVRRVEA